MILPRFDDEKLPRHAEMRAPLMIVWLLEADWSVFPRD